VLGFCKHALSCAEYCQIFFSLLSASLHNMYLAVSVLRRAAPQPVPLSLSLSPSLPHSRFLPVKTLARPGIETEIISAVYVETVRLVLETVSRSWFRNRIEIPPK
jgi:hypothetical protein